MAGGIKAKRRKKVGHKTMAMCTAFFTVTTQK
jgi:hypothetical protein